MNAILQARLLSLDQLTGDQIVESATAAMMHDVAQPERSFPPSFQLLVVSIIKYRPAKQDQISFFRCQIPSSLPLL